MLLLTKTSASYSTFFSYMERLCFPQNRARFQSKICDSETEKISVNNYAARDQSIPLSITIRTSSIYYEQLLFVLFEYCPFYSYVYFAPVVNRAITILCQLKRTNDLRNHFPSSSFMTAESSAASVDPLIASRMASTSSHASSTL